MPRYLIETPAAIRLTLPRQPHGAIDGVQI